MYKVNHYKQTNKKPVTQKQTTGTQFTQTSKLSSNPKSVQFGQVSM